MVDRNRDGLGVGGTVSYAIGTGPNTAALTDTAANFNTTIVLPTQAQNPFVRVMPVLATNSGGTVTYDAHVTHRFGSEFQPGDDPARTHHPHR